MTDRKFEIDESRMFVSKTKDVPPVTGSRDWYALTVKEQDEFLLTCFRGTKALEEFTQRLDLYDRISSSIARALLGDPNFEKETRSVPDTQMLLARRARALENTLLGDRLLRALAREELRSRGEDPGEESAVLDPMLFFYPLGNPDTKGFYYLAEECVESYADLGRKGVEQLRELPPAVQKTIALHKATISPPAAISENTDAEKLAEAKKVIAAIDQLKQIGEMKRAMARSTPPPSWFTIWACLNELPRAIRAAIVLFAFWTMLVIYRTVSSHVLLGIYLEEWSDEQFFSNWLILPGVVLAAGYAGKWLKGNARKA